MTRQQLLDTYPELEEVIDEIEVGAGSLYGEDYPNSNLKNSQNILTPAEAKSLDYQVSQKFQILDRFYKVKVPYYRLFNIRTYEGSTFNVDFAGQIFSSKKISAHYNKAESRHIQ